MILDSKIPEGPLAEKWSKHKFNLKLVNPANKRKYTVIVVGSGLAGASAAASLAELGYNVKVFCFQELIQLYTISFMANPAIIRMPFPSGLKIRTFKNFKLKFITLLL